MSWAVGFDPRWRRDVGYGVPALCDHPHCSEQIERGLAFVCGGALGGGDHGCGLHFCAHHLGYGERNPTIPRCARCRNRRPPYTPKPDLRIWLAHKLCDASWARWRFEQPAALRKLIAQLDA